MAPDKPWRMPKELSPALESIYLNDAHYTITDPVLGKKYPLPTEKQKKKQHHTKATKKDPQTKVTQFFPTKLNYQGRPLHQCVFEEVVNDFVWVPPLMKAKSTTCPFTTASSGTCKVYSLLSYVCLVS